MAAPTTDARQLPTSGPADPGDARRTPTRRLAPLVLLGAAGLCVAASTSNHAVPVLAWLAPVLLLRFVRTTPRTTGLVSAGVTYALAFAVAWHAQWPVPPLLLAGLATVFFLPYVVDRLLGPRLRPGPRTLLLPFAWISVEYALVYLPLLEGSPIGAWAAVVHSQYGQLPLLQLLAVTGQWGIAFLVAWTAAVANLVWDRGVADRQARRLGAGALMLLVLVLTAGGARLALAAAPEATVRVAGVVVENDEILVRTWSPVRQGMPLEHDDREALTDELTALHDRLFELSEREIAAGAQVVVWAEDNALVFREEADALVGRGQAFAAEHGIALFMGMVVIGTGEPADNQVVGVTPDGEVAFTYLKSFPAPGEGSRAGDGRIAWMDTPWGRIGAAICFDHDFPPLIRQAGRAGLDVMVNPADDTPVIDPLHPHMAVPRAIENGFAMVRPAQGARSIAVDALGRVLTVQEAVGPARSFAVDLPVAGRATAYARIGDVVAHVAMAGLVLVPLAGRRRAATGNPHATGGQWRTSKRS
ncbi:nitrilase-related carbon-nitrogen hydrolase [Egicoccus sp. AB-alg2]|uniref:nitrilase-related carbon-nitrogen hydrolase n=1 Tax=Egicoccus sp. AB-alg2 TaxID=3242693 RepID=UPI00359D24E8